MARKGDIELSIIFNAKTKIFTIKEIIDSQDKLLSLVGYNADELLNGDVQKIFAEDVNTAIDDYLEIDGNLCNIISILSRIRDFSLTSKSGDNIKTTMRIASDVSTGENTCYRIFIKSENQTKNKLLEALAAVCKDEILDQKLNISTKEFFYKKAQIVDQYLDDDSLNATLSIIRIDKFSNVIELFGKDTGDGLLNEIATRCDMVARCKSSFRAADIIGYLGDGRFGVVFIDTDAPNSLIPINRLRNAVAHQPMFLGGNDNIKATISVTYRQMDKDKNSLQIIEDCTNELNQHEDDCGAIIKL